MHNYDKTSTDFMNFIDVTQAKYMKYCYKHLKASQYGSMRFIYIINHFKSRTLLT